MSRRKFARSNRCDSQTFYQCYFSGVCGLLVIARYYYVLVIGLIQFSLSQINSWVLVYTSAYFWSILRFLYNCWACVILVNWFLHFSFPFSFCLTIITPVAFCWIATRRSSRSEVVCTWIFNDSITCRNCRELVQERSGRRVIVCQSHAESLGDCHRLDSAGAACRRSGSSAFIVSYFYFFSVIHL